MKIEVNISDKPVAYLVETQDEMIGWTCQIVKENELDSYLNKLKSYIPKIIDEPIKAYIWEIYEIGNEKFANFEDEDLDENKFYFKSNEFKTINLDIEDKIDLTKIFNKNKEVKSILTFEVDIVNFMPYVVSIFEIGNEYYVENGSGLYKITEEDFKQLQKAKEFLNKG